MTCEDIANFKGLCRNCTEYDDNGTIVNAVRRIRIDEYGNEYVPVRHEPQRLTHEMMVMQRKSARRLTKRQKAEMKERLKAQAEAVKAAADTEVSEDGLMEFGEEVEHTPSPGCGPSCGPSCDSNSSEEE